jgi:hypothetical protein
MGHDIVRESPGNREAFAQLNAHLVESHPHEVNKIAEAERV